MHTEQMKVFLFSTASWNDIFAHRFGWIQLKHDIQAIDGAVAFIDFPQTPHTYNHFEDMSTRLNFENLHRLHTLDYFFSEVNANWIYQYGKTFTQRNNLKNLIVWKTDTWKSE